MKGKKEYKLLVRLEDTIKKPLQKKAKDQERSINGEINHALKNHLGLNEKDKSNNVSPQ
jgi:hypothetical protein